MNLAQSFRFSPGTPRFAQRKSGQLGVAILMAMLTVTLVASLAAAAVWQQFRATEVEASERARVQASALLVGALDWARLILREDLRAGAVDHLGEPWSIGLEESRLSSFLAADQANSALLDDSDDVFLSGQMTDMQSRFNIGGLVEGGKINEAQMRSWLRLVAFLELSETQARTVAENLRFSSDPGREGVVSASTPLKATRIEDLQRMGLSKNALLKLAPFVSLLPKPTPVNMNTASAETIFASVPTIDIADARKIVSVRDRDPFKSLVEVGRVVPQVATQLNDTQHSVSTKYFEVIGRLRVGELSVQERSLVNRESLNDIRVVWRERSTSAKSLIAGGGKPASALLQSGN